MPTFSFTFTPSGKKFMLCIQKYVWPITFVIHAFFFNMRVFKASLFSE
jgi:hypothetical protein